MTDAAHDRPGVSVLAEASRLAVGILTHFGIDPATVSSFRLEFDVEGLPRLVVTHVVLLDHGDADALMDAVREYTLVPDI